MISPQWSDFEILHCGSFRLDLLFSYRRALHLRCLTPQFRAVAGGAARLKVKAIGARLTEYELSARYPCREAVCLYQNRSSDQL